MSPLTESTRLTLAKQSVAPGLLDAYGGAAAAYSLRSLSANYTGPVVRVRRSSDNTEQDFTATQVTDGTLTTFCGAGNGFVRTWYDQSGNANNAGQATTASQPQIVSAGSLILEASKPVIKFDGSDDTLIQVNNTTISQPFTTVIAAKRNGSPSGSQNLFRAASGDSNPTAVIYWNASVGDIQIFAGSVISLANTSTNNLLVAVAWAGSASVRSLNGSQVASDPGSGYLTSAEPLRIGRGASVSEFANMSLREFIIYPSNQAAGLAGINSNINAHYAIY
jgi:hypothetical protein